MIGWVRGKNKRGINFENGRECPFCGQNQET